MAYDRDICTFMENAFLDMYKKHGNGRWAVNELEWFMLDKNKESFSNFKEEEQWEFRNYITALRQIYGEKEEGEL